MEREFHVRYMDADLHVTTKQFPTEATARRFMEICGLPIMEAWVKAPIPIPKDAIG